MRFVLKAAGSIDDQHVLAVRRGLLDAVEHDSRGVAAFLAGNDRRTDPIAPDLQLFDGGGAERIARGQQNTIILLLEPMAELADGRGLARAVDADHQDHVRPGKTPDLQWLRDWREDLLDLLGQDRPKAPFVEPFEFLGSDGFPNAARRLRTQVRGNQRFFDIVERRGVERRAAGQACEVVGDAIGGLLEPAAQAVEPAHFQIAVSRSPWRPLTRAVPLSPRFAPGMATGAKLPVWPVPLPSISTGWTLPMRLSSQFERRRRAASRKRAARALISLRSTWGIRAAGVFGRGEKGKI